MQNGANRICITLDIIFYCYLGIPTIGRSSKSIFLLGPLCLLPILFSSLVNFIVPPTAAISSASDSQAQLKARHNQIRVTNINAELSAIQERTEARSRRLAEIKSLLAENDALSTLSHAVHERNLSDRTLSSLANHGLSSATHGLSSASHGLSSLANHGLSSSIATHGLSSLATHGLSHVIPERSQGLALKSIGY